MHIASMSITSAHVSKCTSIHLLQQEISDDGDVQQEEEECMCVSGRDGRSLCLPPNCDKRKPTY